MCVCVCVCVCVCWEDGGVVRQKLEITDYQTVKSGKGRKEGVPMLYESLIPWIT